MQRFVISDCAHIHRIFPLSKEPSTHTQSRFSFAINLFSFLVLFGPFWSYISISGGIYIHRIFPLYEKSIIKNQTLNRDFPYSKSLSVEIVPFFESPHPILFSVGPIYRFLDRFIEFFLCVNN